MASIPFRRRGRLAKVTRTARNVAIADAALALARDRMGGRSHGRRPSRRTLLLGGTAVAVAAGVLWKRDKVAGLLPSRTESHEPWSTHQPGPSNYDAPGPVANTATPVPAPEPKAPPAVDEAAEEASAAAEAANIGGSVSDYAGPADLPAAEAERPLAEAGEGEAEGQEQTELGLEQAAEPTAPGKSDAERQIEDAIDAAASPAVGEQVEPVAPAEEPSAEEEPASEGTAWTPPTTPADADEPAPVESETAGDEEAPAAADESGKDDGKDGGSDWSTWSGRSVKP